MREALVAGGAATALLALLWVERPQGVTEYRFQNRAIVKPNLMRRLWPSKIPQTVIDSHDQVANWALMIRDLRVVNHDDFTTGDWSFQKLLDRAAGIPIKDSAQSEAAFGSAIRTAIGNEYVQSGPAFSSGWNASGAPPVQLLAVVNRLDLAHVDSTGCIRGAEIRFDYAATQASGNDYLRLILEFQLPCMAPADFLTLAQAWMQVEAEAPVADTDPVDKYRNDLETMLLTTELAKPQEARLRTNGLGANGWAPREFLIGQSTLTSRRLEREPNVSLGDCQERPKDDSGNPSLAAFAAQQTGNILISDYEFDGWPGLTCIPGQSSGSEPCLPSFPQLGSGTPLTLVLGAKTVPSDKLDDVRFSLALNACTQCHFAETNTQVSHLSQRSDSSPSSMSGFLTGDSGCLPSLSPSGAAHSVTYCTVATHTMTNSHGSCKGVELQDRQFNDLMRRHLFLDAALKQTPKTSAEDWNEALTPFVANQTH